MQRVLIVLFLWLPLPLVAEQVSSSWVDPNYAFCAGLGGHATGRVEAVADVERGIGFGNIHSLVVKLWHSAANTPTGSIRFTNAYGNEEIVQLEAAWFSEMKALNGTPRTLYLPRVRTTPTPGPNEQRAISILDGTAIEFDLTLLFFNKEGSCPTSFNVSWKP